MKRSMTVALAQTGSERSASMTGASDASIRTAASVGAENADDEAVCAWTKVVVKAEKAALARNVELKRGALDKLFLLIGYA